MGIKGGENTPAAPLAWNCYYKTLLSQHIHPSPATITFPLFTIRSIPRTSYSQCSLSKLPTMVIPTNIPSQIRTPSLPMPSSKSQWQTHLPRWELNDSTSSIVYFLSPRTIICPNPLIPHSLLVSCSVKRFITPLITTGVSASSKTVFGPMLCFGLLFLTSCLLILTWIVSIFIHLPLAYWNTLSNQTMCQQRPTDPRLPTWLVLVDLCLYLPALLCRHSWNIPYHSKCPWMLTLWWRSHLIIATRMFTRRMLLWLCHSINHPRNLLMFAARSHEERLRYEPCYATSSRILIA